MSIHPNHDFSSSLGAQIASAAASHSDGFFAGGGGRGHSLIFSSVGIAGRHHPLVDALTTQVRARSVQLLLYVAWSPLNLLILTRLPVILARAAQKAQKLVD